MQIKPKQVNSLALSVTFVLLGALFFLGGSVALAQSGSCPGDPPDIYECPESDWSYNPSEATEWQCSWVEGDCRNDDDDEETHRARVIVEGPGTVTDTYGIHGINCSSDCRYSNRTSSNSTTWTVTAEPDSGARFVGWDRDSYIRDDRYGNSRYVCGTYTTCEVEGGDSGTITFTATFEEAETTKRLGVRTTGDGSGTVTGDGYTSDINCSGSSTTSPGCSDVETSTSTYADWTLTATPDTGSEFTGWSWNSIYDFLGSFGRDCDYFNTCSVRTTSTVIVDAEFATTESPVEPPPEDSNEKSLNVDVTGNGSGTVSEQWGNIDCSTGDSPFSSNCTDVKDTTYTYASWNLTADPDPGSEFKSWSEGPAFSSRTDCNTSDTCQVRTDDEIYVEVEFGEDVAPPPPAPAPEITDFYADPQWIRRESDTTFHWTVNSDVDECTIERLSDNQTVVISSPQMKQEYSGDLVVSIDGITQYEFTCENQDGTQADPEQTTVYMLPEYQEF